MSERKLVGHIRSWRHSTSKWVVSEFTMPLADGERITFDPAQGAVVVRNAAGDALAAVRGVTQFYVEQGGRDITWTDRPDLAAVVDL